MTTAARIPKPFTGRHMLAIMIAFFGVIISVNMLMAWYANSSWSGLISKNTYVASQDFNIKAHEARAWAEEGFGGVFAVKGNVLEYTLKGPTAKIDHLRQVTAMFHRPVGDKQDFTIRLDRQGDGVFTTAHDLAAGQWIVDIAAIDNGYTVFHQAERIHVREK